MTFPKTGYVSMLFKILTFSLIFNQYFHLLNCFDTVHRVGNWSYVSDEKCIMCVLPMVTTSLGKNCVQPSY